MSLSRLLLVFSVLCAVFSITPIADDWQVLVRLAPEWTLVPNGYPYDAPHEVVVQTIVTGWQSGLQAAANVGWLTQDQAAALIADGLPLKGVLQGVAALLFVLSAFLWALVSVQVPKRVPAEKNSPAETSKPDLLTEPAMPIDRFGTQEPALIMPSVSPVASISESSRSVPVVAGSVALSVEERLANLELQVANLLLNPDAQPVAEELVDLNRDLRELSRALTSSNLNRS